MADAKTFDFGLGAITESLSNQAALALKRAELERQNQVKEQEVIKQKAQLAQKSMDIQSQLIDSMSPLMDALKTTTAAAEEQKKLRESGTLSGFLEAEGNKILDPAKYTKAGRAATIATEQQKFQINSEMATQKQALLEQTAKVVDMNLLAGATELQKAQLDEKLGQEKIQTELTRVATQGQFMQNSIILQDQVLSTLDSNAARAAYEKSGGKPVDIGGVMIAPGLLEKRAIEAEKYDLAKENAALAAEAKNETLRLKNMRAMAQHMSIDELRKAMVNPSPDQDVQIMQQVYDVKVKARTDMVTQATQQAQFTDIAASVLVPAKDDIVKMSAAARPGTIVADGVTAYTKSMTQAGILLAQIPEGQPVPLEVAVMVQDIVTKGKATAEAAIAKQIAVESKGDENLKSMLNSVYHGEPINQGTVETAVNARLTKNQSLADIFPPAVATRIKKRYDELYSDLLKKSAMSFGGDTDKELLRQQAQRQAIEEGIMQSIPNRADDRQVLQLSQPRHPLAGFYTPTALLTTVREADQAGEEKFMQINGLTPEEMNELRNGRDLPQKNILASNARSQLYAMQNQALFLSMDTKEPGLSAKYAQWWAENGDKYAADTAQKRLANTKTLEEGALETFANGIELNQTQEYNASIQDAHQMYDNEKIQRRKDMMSFNLDPVQKQAAALQFDSTLNDAERKQFMKGFIVPIIQQAKEAKLDYNATNQKVEQAIEANMSNDPVIAKILKKVAVNRTTVNENLESIANPIPNLAWWNPVPAKYMAPQFLPENQKGKRNYQWLIDAANEGN